MNDKPVIPKMIVMYITTWAGISFNAEHCYGKIILIDPMWKDIRLDNIEDYGIDTFGENIKVEKELTLQECKKLDRKDNDFYESRGVRIGSLEREYKEGLKPKSDRFDTPEELNDWGIGYWLNYCKSKKIDVPFISLYHGEKKSFTVEYKSVEDYEKEHIV